MADHLHDLFEVYDDFGSIHISRFSPGASSSCDTKQIETSQIFVLLSGFVTVTTNDK